MLPAVLASAVVATLAACVHRHGKALRPLTGRPGADRVLHATTRDGWRIAIHNWTPRAARRRLPVLLCHGLASCAATWDLGRGPSLARWLAARGHDVFALDLRGGGESDRPRPFGRHSYGFGVHEYIAADIPAAVERVLGETGAESLHWVGHSMGGILGLALAPREIGRRFASTTTVGSAIDYKVGDSRLGELRGAASLLRLLHAAPVGSFARAYAPFAKDRFLDEFMFAPESLDPWARRAIWASAFTWVPGRVLRELATTFDEQGFRGRDGALWEEGLEAIASPLFVIAGTRDLQCPPVAARATFEAAGASEKRFLLAEGLGHFDLLLSEQAEREVFPAIADWIERRA